MFNNINNFFEKIRGKSGIIDLLVQRDKRSKKKKMKTRESKFELLRIVCMLFVITEHLVPYISDMQKIGGGGVLRW